MCIANPALWISRNQASQPKSDVTNRDVKGSSPDRHVKTNRQQREFMSITTTGNLGPLILQSLAPAMLYVPTPTMNYITVCDKVSMPANGGTTIRFMRPRALQPPTVQLGNSGIDPPAQVPQRDIIDAQMAFFGDNASAEILFVEERLVA